MQLFPSFVPQAHGMMNRKGTCAAADSIASALSLMHAVISVHLWPVGDDLQ